MNDWFEYAEQTTARFIERFAGLDPDEHPDKVVEIAKATQLKTLRDKWKAYGEAIDEMLRGETGEGI